MRQREVPPGFVVLSSGRLRDRSMAATWIAGCTVDLDAIEFWSASVFPYTMIIILYCGGRRSGDEVMAADDEGSWRVYELKLEHYHRRIESYYKDRSSIWIFLMKSLILLNGASIVVILNFIASWSKGDALHSYLPMEGLRVTMLLFSLGIALALVSGVIFFAGWNAVIQNAKEENEETSVFWKTMGVVMFVVGIGSIISFLSGAYVGISAFGRMVV